MKDSTFCWCVIVMLASWCGAAWLAAWISAVVAIGPLAWIRMPTFLTAFVFVVATEMFISDLQDTRRTCGPPQTWRDALPSGLSVFAVVLFVGVIWGSWYVCAVVAVGPLWWIKLPAVPSMVLLWFVALMLFKRVCDGKDGAL